MTLNLPHETPGYAVSGVMDKGLQTFTDLKMLHRATDGMHNSFRFISFC